MFPESSVTAIGAHTTIISQRRFNHIVLPLALSQRTRTPQKGIADSSLLLPQT